MNANNQLSGSPYVYDAAGNMTHDANHAYAYDEENRLISVDSGSTATYVYDAESRRVQKTVGSTSTGYVYDFSNQPLTEVTPSGWTRSYAYLGSQVVAQYTPSATYFVHSDHLGSTRLLTGYPTASVVECDDYYPFGELISCGSTTTTTHKFTGKERDSESNLDNFGARYNSSSLGRFMTPDWAARPTAVPYATLGNPQSLNLYSYVEDDPVTRADLDGHCGQVTVAGAPPKNAPTATTPTRSPAKASKATPASTSTRTQAFPIGTSPRSRRRAPRTRPRRERSSRTKRNRTPTKTTVIGAHRQRNRLEEEEEEKEVAREKENAARPQSPITLPKAYGQ